MPDHDATPTLGQILKSAREGKGVTASAAAATTRLKIQAIEAMERDDFSRVPAPTYAKGFLRLYANYLGLNPVPLIAEYEAKHAGGGKPVLTPQSKGRAAEAKEAPPAAGGAFWRDGISPWWVGGIVLALLLAVAWLVWPSPGNSGPAGRAPNSLMKEPPEPYMDRTGSPP